MNKNYHWDDIIARDVWADVLQTSKSPVGFFLISPSLRDKADNL